MGGKSRKMGIPSKKLIAILKKAPIIVQKEGMADEILNKREEEILQGVAKDCEEWNSSVEGSLNSKGEK